MDKGKDDFLEKNKQDYDFIIANVENASHGFGLTEKNYNELDKVYQNNTNIKETKKINNSNKYNNPISLNKNIKRLTVTTSLDKNSLFKNKITNKTVFEFLLKSKCDNIRAQIFDNIGSGKNNWNKNDKNNKFIINNNFDIRDDKYIKNLFLGTKFSRAKSFNEDKFAINKWYIVLLLF